MSAPVPKAILVVLAIGLAGLVAACARPAKEEFVVVEPDAVTSEDAQTGEF